MNKLEIKAQRFCVIAHGDQKRKYTDEPYWKHPFMVARIMKLRGHPIDAICAAYLHDTIEDTKTTRDDLEIFFNNHIAQLVFEVSDISKYSDGNRARRKEIDREHISKASFLGKSIKLADLIHNSQSILKYDKNFAKVYMKEKIALLEVLQDGDKKLFEHAKEIVVRNLHILRE